MVGDGCGAEHGEDEEEREPHDQLVVLEQLCGAGPG